MRGNTSVSMGILSNPKIRIKVIFYHHIRFISRLNRDSNTILTVPIYIVF